MKRRRVLAVLTMTVGALMTVFGGVAAATKPAPDHKVTICHATASATNPYVSESVDVASIEDFVNGTGHGASGVNAGDIIPPFTYEDFTFAGQGDQSILEAGCVVATATTTTLDSTTTSSSVETTPSTVGENPSTSTTTSTTSQTTLTTVVSVTSTTLTPVVDPTTNSSTSTSLPTPTTKSTSPPTTAGWVVTTSVPSRALGSSSTTVFVGSSGASELPHTGSGDAVALFLVGVLLLLTGLALASWRKHGR